MVSPNKGLPSRCKLADYFKFQQLEQ